MAVPPAFAVGHIQGIPGERFSASQVAVAWGVSLNLVVSWITRGWLRASCTRYGYRIRMRALRRAVLDHPQIAEAVLRANRR